MNWHCWKFFSAAMLYFGTVDVSTTAPKKFYSTMPLLITLRHCWTISCFPAAILYFGMLMASTTVRKQRLFISQFLMIIGTVEQWFSFFFCGGSVVLRHCCSIQCRKECYTTTPIFAKFYTADHFINFRRQKLRRFWWLVQQCQKHAIQQCQLLMASTTVRKQRLFISANSWWKLALLKMLFFCGGSVVLRHCWELVQLAEKNGSTTTIFAKFLALLINLFQAAM